MFIGKSKPPETGLDALGPGPVHALVDHIQSTHHEYLKRELPLINQLVARVTRAHGSEYPSLVELRSLVEELSAELHSHMMKEENVLFPMARAMSRGQKSAEDPLGGIENPIEVMELEHADTNQTLAKMRAVTRNFRLPDGAVSDHRALFDRLRCLEEDLIEHIRKENKLLHPMLRALSRQEIP